MKRMQSGMTLIGFILVLAMVGVFAYMGMKLIPMYSEYYAVRQALNGLASEPGVTERDAAKIEDLFFRRLYVSYADNIKPEHVKVLRKEAGWEMTVDYEIRRPLIGNIDVVGRFHAQKELRRGAVSD